MRANKLSTILTLFVAVIVILYGLSWAAYGLKYSRDRQIVLQHYGGLTTYACTGGVALPDGHGYVKVHPTSYFLPFKGISYTIKYGIGPNIATGKESLLGKVTQTNIQYSNNPECALL